MMQLPHAIPDDGLLDITLIKKIGKLTVITQINKLFDGSFVNHPKIQTFRGQKITVESSPEVLIEIDGESLGHSPFSFDILPKALNVIAEKMPTTED
jgi:diacylglycerol kinase family enzyme